MAGNGQGTLILSTVSWLGKFPSEKEEEEA